MKLCMLIDGKMKKCYSQEPQMCHYPLRNGLPFYGFCIPTVCSEHILHIMAGTLTKLSTSIQGGTMKSSAQEL